MNDPKAILLKILEVIDYEEDKEQFATEFLQNVSLQALLDLINTLPQDKKDQLGQKMQSFGSDTVKMQEELKNYFQEDQIGQAIENASRNSVTEYMKAIEPTLSEEQKTNLATYFQHINQSA